MPPENDDVIDSSTDDFDMAAATAELSEGLFPSDEPAEGDLDLEVKPLVEDTPAVEVKPEAKPETPAAMETPPVEDKPAVTGDIAVAPKTWKPEAAAAWATIPESARQEILRREADMFRGIEGYKFDANIGKQMKDIVAPYEGIMKQAGINPFDQVKQLMEAHYTLATGSAAQKVQFMHKLATDYGVDLGIEAPYVAPEVASLQQELNGLKSRLHSFESQGQESARAAITKEIDTFAADPKNVYFDEVAVDVARILKGGLAPNLAEAYQMAVRVNPVTFQKEQARLLKEQQDADKAAAQERTRMAKAASSANVRSRAKSGSVTATAGSIDDTLKATLAEIESRT